MAYIGKSPSQGVRNRFQYQATAGQDSFSGSDANGLTLTYTDSLYMDVYQNGILLVPGDDYTATTGTTVVLVQSASLDDIIEMVVYDVFSVPDAVSQSAGGTFSGAVTFGGGVVVADGGNIGSASDTDAMSISSGGVVTFSQTPVGAFIAEADMFRLTSDTSNGANADVTANLERVDDATFSKIGTGMTESSGIFTFPSTGLYQVICNPSTIAVSDNQVGVITNVSSNSGGAFDECAVATGGGGGSAFDMNSVYSCVFVNVTNASTFQVKFTTSGFSANCRLQGDSNRNRTSFSFIKLGASQ